MSRYLKYDKTDLKKQMLQNKSIYVINFKNNQGVLLCKSHPCKFIENGRQQQKNELMIGVRYP